jgi:signal transduction histidine kinase
MEKIDFGDNELGEIGQKIYQIYCELKNTGEQLYKEKAKLLTHLDIFNYGIVIFTQDLKVVSHNKLFIDYVSVIIGQNNLDENLAVIFEHHDFEIVNSIIRDKNEKSILWDNQILHSSVINTGHQIFEFKCIGFQDDSFELVLGDITELENQKKVKQQLTSNISHELKTPVAAISGYLETILNTPDINKNTLIRFIENSFSQTQRLTELINDISILNKLDEAKELFKLNKVNLHGLIKEIFIDFEFRIRDNISKTNNNIPEGLAVNGNRFLLEAIFRNLLDNSLKYSGKYSVISIEKYFEDDEYYYFSFSDNGQGIEQVHLNRIFERFYRIDHGRSRQTGGSGLGLSIVKHAVEFHQGKIYVKSEKQKGVTFSFSLKK